ncbi:cellulase family glycosylhydrolase [Rhodococcus tibetensis]|uniref:Cellulase family glycosylhydrolase n=1 Tax=Rhodococcus tibetensis TaxID=2965064 RepID=A0ABT1QII4_9NOCA|nr:cellulase family glycosylhydrolase [Rhodococcus sp. FXJ9.536]MCQ4120895.1 cellulase family glycosylhydrolase [Rhodococcus sp. FXJ9.536]
MHGGRYWGTAGRRKARRLGGGRGDTGERRRLILVAAIVLVVSIGAGTMVLLRAGSGPETQTPALPPPATQSPPVVGVGDSGQLLDAPDADVAQALDAVTALGATSIRLPITWAFVEPEQGVLDWSPVDRIVVAAEQRDLSILGMIAYSPGWAAVPGAAGLSALAAEPSSPALFGQFAGRVAERYRDRIAAYEVWNEPNSSLFFAPASDPVAYTDLLKAAYREIKDHDPAALVVGGAITSVVDSPIFMNAVDFARGMYDAGAQGHFDALSFHPYHRTTGFAAGTIWPESPIRQLIDIRQLMVQHGDQDKKIWATEYGLPSAEVPGTTASALIANFLTTWQELPYGGPLYLFEIIDRGTGSADPEHTFGLLTGDFTPKLTFLAAQHVLGQEIPLSSEASRFAGKAPPSLGEIRSPVYAVGTSLRQEFEDGTLYETDSGYVVVPPPIAAKMRQSPARPTTQFADGTQQFEGDTGLRAFTSPAGTFLVHGAILDAYDPALGFPVTDEYDTADGRRESRFQHGAITWSSGTGAVVTFA